METSLDGNTIKKQCFEQPSEWELFRLIFVCAATTFGGGYALIPILEASIVEKKKWMDGESFLDALTIAQSIPGVLAVNLSLMLGRQFYRTKGSIIAAIAAMLPSVISVLLISIAYEYIKDSMIMQGFFTGVRPVVSALLFYSFLKLAIKLPKCRSNWILLVITFVATGLFQLNPIWAIIIGGVVAWWHK